VILFALLKHYLRRYRLLFAVVLVLLFVLELAYLYVFQFWKEHKGLADMVLTMMPDDIKRGFGIPLTSLTDPRTYQAIILLKPDVRALTLLFGVALATDVIAGEVGRGTADLLFAHPVRRRTAVLAGALVTAIQLLCVGAVILLAFAAGTALFPMGEHEPTIGQLIPSVVDVVLTSFAIILVAFLVGSLCATRARAVGWSLFIILGSIVLDFMSVFTKVFNPIVRILPEHYYRPHTILFGLQDPSLTKCTIALGLIGAAALGGALYFAERRDLTR